MILYYRELPELVLNITVSTNILRIDSSVFSDGVDVSERPQAIQSGGLAMHS